MSLRSLLLSLWNEYSVEGLITTASISFYIGALLCSGTEWHLVKSWLSIIYIFSSVKVVYQCGYTQAGFGNGESTDCTL